jgi:hypothetical protein
MELNPYPQGLTMHVLNPTRAIPTWIRSIASLLTLVFALHGIAPVAMASPIASSLITAEDARAADIQTIQKALETKVVAHRLNELGFTPAEIQDRITYASDAELHQLASQSETVMAGGDGGILVTILLVVLLILLIQRIASTQAFNPDFAIA